VTLLIGGCRGAQGRAQGLAQVRLRRARIGTEQYTVATTGFAWTGAA